MRLSYLQAAKLAIGAYDGSVFTFAGYTSAGLLTNPGVSIFGASTQIGTVRAGVTIAPPAAIPGIGALPFSLEVTGVSNFVGNTNQLGLYTCNGASIFNGTQTTNGINTVNAASIFNGAVTVNGATIINGAATVNGAFVATNATINPQAWKGFDIKHPKKPNKRIRHICVEGPEAAIYIRGVLKDSNTITLPEYWDGLVDPESITVQLTSIGEYQCLCYKIVDNKVIVKNHNDFSIHCSYSIWASRIDGEPLIVEYEGESPKDYPGGPDQFSIAGYDYGRNIQ